MTWVQTTLEVGRNPLAHYYGPATVKLRIDDATGIVQVFEDRVIDVPFNEKFPSYLNVLAENNSDMVEATLNHEMHSEPYEEQEWPRLVLSGWTAKLHPYVQAAYEASK